LFRRKALLAWPVSGRLWAYSLGATATISRVVTRRLTLLVVLFATLGAVGSAAAPLPRVAICGRAPRSSTRRRRPTRIAGYAIATIDPIVAS